MFKIPNILHTFVGCAKYFQKTTLVYLNNRYQIFNNIHGFQ
ncbi:hypothetical protein NITUZ_40235 [Candidatus Nitrosotenuis uzonensis]|uniref:Uncharacterized protein n=1 Tax=Candidatus Nitrosotenuis uzonensis TaxID=1407055 RepID=V6AU09_9ARCH|nr:hypothetical protein NITUZ_40235 [Candidatus Nitrosotenuis uzonensis]